MSRRSGALGEEPPQRGADLGLRGAAPRAVGVGGVGHQQSNALVTQLSQPRQVGQTTVDGSLVDLEVPRVHERTGGRVQHDAQALGDRVRDRQCLDVERADPPPFAVTQDMKRGAVAQACLGHLVLGKRHRQRRAVQRDLDVAQEVGHSAQVILMSVRHNQSDNVAGTRVQPVHVGQDLPHTGHQRWIRKHDAEVDDQQLAVDLDDGAVASDVAEPAQECDGDGPALAGAQVRFSRA